MKIYIANWTDYSGEEQVMGFTSKKAAQTWIDEMSQESTDLTGEDDAYSVIQEWDTSLDKWRSFFTLHG